MSSMRGFTSAFVVASIFGLGATAATDPPENAPLTLGVGRTVHSRVLGEDREIYVSLPDRYEGSDDRYPVLYVLDAEWHFKHAASLAWFLSQCRHNPSPPLPPMIVVGVVNVDRNRDFTPTHRDNDHGLGFPTSGEAGRFHTFLKTELVPFIDGEYRTHPYRVLSGWSFGGLFSIRALLTDPGLFQAYVAVSPSLWWDGEVLVEQANATLHEKSEVGGTLVITLGTEMGAIRPAVLKFVEVLENRAPAALDWRFHALYGENHNLVPPIALFDGLRLAFGDRTVPETVLDEGLESVRAYYGQLSRKYRYKVLIPEPLLTRMARTHWNAFEDEKALAVCRYRLELYPDSPSAHYFLGAAYANLGKNEQAAESYRRAYDLEAARPDPSELDLKEYLAGLDALKKKGG